MDNFKKFIDIDFKTRYDNCDLTESVSELKTYICGLNNCFDNAQNNLAEIAYYVYKLQEFFCDYTKTYHYGIETKTTRYTFESIMNNFGIDKTQVSRLLRIYTEFVDFNFEKPRIIFFLSGFSKSKLFELLVVDKSQLQKDISNKVLRAEMSVKQIREYVKNYKALQKQNKKLSDTSEETSEITEAIEGDIPPAYDPKQHYEFTYFEKQSKAQLLNIVWELQKEYERLVKLKKK